MPLIPLFILALLGDPAQVRTAIHAEENIICWSSPTMARCFHYSDEGDFLLVHLNEEV